MKGSDIIPRVQLAEHVKNLRLHSQRLHKLLKKLQQNSDIKSNNLHRHLHKAIRSAQHIVNLSSEISHIKTFSLLEEEYVYFCDFIICGSEMAEYLAEHKIVKKTMRNHACYWLKLIKKFKPFLQSSILSQPQQFSVNYNYLKNIE